VRSRVFGLAAVFALIAVSCGGGSSEGTAALGDGIGVHGAWTIDVVNADGTVANHVEFDNALLPSGAQAIAELLSPFSSVSTWRILAGKNDLAAGDSPCGVVGASVPCEVNSPQLAIPGDGRLILQGSFVAEIDGGISLVATQVVTCDTADPTNCSVPTDFTQKTVVDPDTGARVSVNAGQTVDIEVEFSFGTLP